MATNRTSTSMLLRLRREESGFAMVTAIVLLGVMSLLMIVAISAGDSVQRLAERGSRWTRSLGVAEAGVNDAIVHLSGSLSALPSSTGCPYDGSATAGCASPGGQYQVTWSRQSRGTITIEAYGYYPTASAYLSSARNALARRVRVTMAPPSTFDYALFSATTLELKNDMVVVGDIFANEEVTIGNNAVICGNVVNPTGGVSLGNGASIVEDLAGIDCENEASIRSGGNVSLGGTAVVEGDVTASGPTEVDCPPSPDQYWISGGTVEGSATACGSVSTTTFDANPNTKTSPPVTQQLPSFTFDSANYTDLTCFPSGSTCDPATTSATSVDTFNSTVSMTNLTGTYAIWQTQPTSLTKLDLDGLTLAGDLTIVTNAPIDLGNTGTVTTSVPGSLLTVISLYIPPTGSSCTDNGGDCSIYGKNAVQFDSGDPDDPDDGVIGLLYTPGKMAFKNNGNEGEGALWAGSIDLKNGFDITYNSAVERMAGFGGTVEQVLWEELAP